MKKKTLLWKVSKLMDRVNRIEFPEYQREPTIWTRPAKQRLVDSIVRDFDISAIYLYSDRKESWDCVDGRQRISAIRSFFGENPDDKDDNGFDYRLMNEIFDDDDHPYESLHGWSYEEIQAQADDGDEVAESFVETLADYPVTVVVLSDSERPEEFNLQFTRLNLGQLIISGEKLHAMVGDLRDVCFGKFGRHPFLRGIDIPTRRYAQQQLAAQIVSQVFDLEESRRDGGERRFARMRHLDLQRLFKVHMRMGRGEEGLDKTCRGHDGPACGAARRAAISSQPIDRLVVGPAGLRAQHRRRRRLGVRAVRVLLCRAPQVAGRFGARRQR